MGAQRNQNRGQSCDLRPDQPGSTVANSACKAAALSTLSLFAWGCQVIARRATGRAGRQWACGKRTRQASLAIHCDRMPSMEAGGEGHGSVIQRAAGG